MFTPCFIRPAASKLQAVAGLRGEEGKDDNEGGEDDVDNEGGEDDVDDEEMGDFLREAKERGEEILGSRAPMYMGLSGSFGAEDDVGRDRGDDCYEGGEDDVDEDDVGSDQGDDFLNPRLWSEDPPGMNSVSAPGFETDGGAAADGVVLFAAVDDMSGGSAGAKRKVGKAYQHDDYYHRHPSLYFLNFYEYSALFSRAKKKVDEDDQSKDVKRRWIPGQIPRKGAGRPAQLGLPFGSGHPLHETHYSSLRKVQCTPMVAGTGRPPYSHWKATKTRRSFVLFYAALFIPWWPKEGGPETVGGVKSAEQYLQPREFAKLMRSWSPKEGGDSDDGLETEGSGGGNEDKRAASGCAVFECRYLTVFNIVRNFNTSKRARILSQRWRARGADKWENLPAEEIPSKSGYTMKDLKAHAADAAAARVLLERLGGGAFDSRKKTQANKELAYLSKQEEKMDAMVAGASTGGDLDENGGGGSNPQETHSCPVQDFAEQREMCATLRREFGQPRPEEKEDEVGSASSVAGAGLPTVTDEELLSKLGYVSLNDEQRTIFESIVGDVTNREQVLALIVGNPGTGKTFLCGAIEKVLRARGFRSIAAAFMWSAVFQLKELSCRKMSIHKLCGLGLNKRLTSRAVQKNVSRKRRRKRVWRGCVMGMLSHSNSNAGHRRASSRKTLARIRRCCSLTRSPRRRCISLVL